MIPKQKEMDDIVRDIYSSMENEDHLANTLFVLCGDHGMNDGGNHGGSSPGETSPALVFISPKLTKVTKNARKESPIKPKEGEEFEYYRLVEQSDIAPTLAGLLGFPVPKNNLGVFIEEFLGFWDGRECCIPKAASDRVQLLYRNAQQIKNIVKATYTGWKFPEAPLAEQVLGIKCPFEGVSLATARNCDQAANSHRWMDWQRALRWLAVGNRLLDRWAWMIKSTFTM